MTATVLDMLDYRCEFAPSRTALEQVEAQISHRVTPTILAQAQARAESNVKNGLHPNVAAARAVSWALCAIHPEPQEAA